MPFIEWGVIATGLFKDGIGRLLKWGCVFFSDFRRGKRVASLEAAIADLRRQLDTAVAECARMKVIELDQLRLIDSQQSTINDQKSLINEQAALLKEREITIRDDAAIIEEFNDFTKRTADFERTTIIEDCTVVYSNKKKAKTPSDVSYLCPHCYDNRKYSGLLYKDTLRKFCPSCGNEFLFTRLSPGGAWIV